MASNESLQKLSQQNNLFDYKHRRDKTAQFNYPNVINPEQMGSEYKEKYVEWPIQTLKLTIPPPPSIGCNGQLIDLNDPKYFSVVMPSEERYQSKNSKNCGRINRLTKERAPNMFAWSLQERYANTSIHGITI